MTKRLLIVTTLLVQGRFGLAWAADTRPAPAGTMPLAALLQDLGSEEFAVRDRARAELDKLPRELEPAVTGAAGRATAPAAAVPAVRVIFERGPALPLRLRNPAILTWTITRRMGSSMGPMTAQMVEIVLAQTTRETTLPVVITDYEVAANTPLPPARM